MSVRINPVRRLAHIGCKALLALAFLTNVGAAPQAEAAGDDELVIYTYDAFPEALEELIVEAFAPEVSVRLERFTDTGGLYTEVVFAAEEGSSPDLVIGLDTTYAGRALEAGLFQPYRPAEAASIREDVIVDDQFRLVPFDFGNIVLNYDSEVLPNPPRTWEELLDPSLRDSIILLNPATSSPGRAFLLLTVAEFGEEGYLEFWERLMPNVLTITSGWTEGYGLYTQGEAPIVLSYETSPAYHLAYEQTDRYRTLVLNDVGYAQIELMGIPVGASNVEAAQAAIDLVLSPPFQAELPLNQFMYPVRDDVTLPDAFAAVNRPSRTVFLPSDRVDASIERWIAAWEAVVR